MKLNHIGHIRAAAEWKPVFDFLEGISKSRARQGLTSEQTALFILSLKKPLFMRLRKAFATDADAMANEIWVANELIDKLSLHTVKAFQKSREDVIYRQQEEMLELSTPVVKLWDGILALPMIGTLDAHPNYHESLLQRIVESGRDCSLNITGVPTVDTLVAQHLLKTNHGDSIDGCRLYYQRDSSQIAQTIVHLGVDLQVSRQNRPWQMLSLAFKRLNITVTKQTRK